MPTLSDTAQEWNGPLPPEASSPDAQQSTGDQESPLSPPPGGFVLEDVIHLFHCPLCNTLWTEPVTLPCGKSICKPCIPEAHVRSRISYPAMEDRREGFLCPFTACAKEHTLGDCGMDVTLNKLTDHIRREMNRGTSLAQQSANAETTQIHHAPQTSSSDLFDSHQNAQSQPSPNVEHDILEAEPVSNGADIDQNLINRKASFARVQELARSELDCQVCYALYHDPLTTGCGHTFCRSCLHRILDHSPYCPICRNRLSISPLLNRTTCSANASLTKIIQTLWSDELATRRGTIEAEEAARLQDMGTSLFICTLAFPRMPTFLHIFEPRYRLLIRRSLEGDKTFGMVLPKRPRHPGDANFYELGTLLRIENAQFFPDGRCLIETVGLSRFRVVRHGSLDGYAISSVERIDDISLEEEEATEAAEMAAAIAADSARFPPPDAENASLAGYASSNSTSSPPITVPSLETMTTQDLMQLATDFVARMREQSVPWMTDRMLAIYGECPVQDPAAFPWWLGSVLPVKDAEKYRLLGSASVRQRLKICCKWIIEWETRTWYVATASHEDAD